MCEAHKLSGGESGYNNLTVETPREHLKSITPPTKCQSAAKDHGLSDNPEGPYEANVSNDVSEWGDKGKSSVQTIQLCAAHAKKLLKI